MFKHEEGFTLIELMVVVLIIAILVAIAVPVFNAARQNAWKRTCQANLRTIDGQIQAYWAEYEAFPAGFNGVAVLTSNHALVTAQYIRTAPQCPRSKAEGDIANSYYTIGNSTAGDLVSGATPQSFCVKYNAQGHSY